MGGWGWYMGAEASAREGWGLTLGACTGVWGLAHGWGSIGGLRSRGCFAPCPHLGSPKYPGAQRSQCGPSVGGAQKQAPVVPWQCPRSGWPWPWHRHCRQPPGPVASPKLPGRQSWQRSPWVQSARTRGHVGTRGDAPRCGGQRWGPSGDSLWQRSQTPGPAVSQLLWKWQPQSTEQRAAVSPAVSPTAASPAASPWPVALAGGEVQPRWQTQV